MPGSAFEARLATALDAEAGRLLGDGLPDAAGFEQLERTCRRVALEAMGRALAARLNADRSDERGTWLACPRGDEPGHGDGLARHAGRRAKTFVTALGEMELSRAWYHCDACGHGFAPRDRELGFGDGGLSPAVLRMVGCAAGEVSFATAGSLLHELAGLNVDAKTVERRAEALGREIAADERDRVAAGPATAPTLYLGLDGTGVPVRGAETEGRAGKQPDGSAKTREAKLAVVWSAERIGADGAPARDPGSVTCSGAIESAATRDTDTVPAPFARRVVREAARRGCGAAERRVVLGDGAAWIWNIAAEHFPGAVEIVDVFHAAEHLHDIAKAVHGRDNDLARGWADRCRDELLAGAFDDLLRAVGAHAGRCEEARKGRAYFADNRRRMDYPGFRALGLCIGSGVVEGACRNVVASRLKRGGMRWTVAGADAILALRSCIVSNRFDDFWQRRAPQNDPSSHNQDVHPSRPILVEGWEFRGANSYPDCRWTADDASARNFSPSAPTTLRTVSNVGTRSPDSAL